MDELPEGERIPRMTRAIRLVTTADARDTDTPTEISVAVRLDAVLDEGRTVTLLDGRGWTAALRGPGAAEGLDAWAGVTDREVEETARVVVGPDEPFGGRTQADMEADHWNALAATLRAAGVDAAGEDLSRLPHDVVLSDGLRAQLDRSSGHH
jgi:hypothetical protein